MESVSLTLLFMHPQEAKHDADPPPLMHGHVLFLNQVSP